MAFPVCCWAMRRSYKLCRLTQNSGLVPKKMSQPQRRVRRYIAVNIQNLGDAIGGNLQMAGQCRSAHLEFFEFLGQMFAEMNGNRWHLISVPFPNGNPNVIEGLGQWMCR
jgi:hypothetical protein